LPCLQLLAGRSLHGILFAGAYAIHSEARAEGYFMSDPRELTRQERTAIRKLVTGLCANYDSEYGCLPLDCECYMLNKWWTGTYCKYFRNAVLPTDPVLEAALLGLTAPDTQACPICGNSFVEQGKQRYCSASCQREADRRKARERMREKRSGGKGV